MSRITQFQLLAALLITLCAGMCAHAVSPDSFVNFETAPIHPLDMSPNGSTLALANTAGGTLEVFDLSSGAPVHRGTISVGIDPTTARFRSDTEVWVVNHISDSINIVNLTTGLVEKTIQTLDEPADVVFAGGKAFVSCSQANTVQVFDAENPGDSISDIPILGEDPKAMAVSADGTKVYVAIFESGNHSTVLFGGTDLGAPNPVSDPDGPYSGKNPPPNDGDFFFPEIAEGFDPIPVALIVRKDAAGKWMDDNQHDWTNFVSGGEAGTSGRVPGWDVVDNDVAIIDAASNTVSGYIEGWMNICMAVAVNPATGAVTVVGTDASNEIRFEPVITGKFIKVLLGISDASAKGTHAIVDLNPHLSAFTSFADTTGTIDQVERDKSIGDPRGIVWNSTGTRGYVTGMGSNNLVVINAAGARLNDIPLELPEGPTGLVLDELREQLYVMNRMHGSVSVVDISSPGAEIEIADARALYFDPTPEVIKIGRKHLYDTHKNSGLGQIACASCHIDGKTDRLSWDLGNPAGEPQSVDGENLGGALLGLEPETAPVDFEPFNPMKGPMTTQTLQDIIGKEPLHWRGDKRGIEEFSGAFMGLQGDDVTLTNEEMTEFKNMVATIRIPPNPFRDLDNSIPDRQIDIPGQFAPGSHGLPRGTPLATGNPTRGLRLYMGTEVDRLRMDAVFNCVTCHTLPLGNGTDGILGDQGYEQLAPDEATGNHHVALVSVDGLSNISIKVPQLRTIYDKTGMDLTNPLSRSGFGFLHDGAVDTVSTFFSANVFSTETDQDLADLAALMMCFSGSDFGDPPQNPPDFYGSLALYAEPFSFQESNDAHAAVGRQATIDSNDPDRTMLDLFLDLADSGSVGLIAKGLRDEKHRGWLHDSGSSSEEDASILFHSDGQDGMATLAELLATAGAGSELTFTVVASETAVRLGIDRDGDGRPDYAEVVAGTDPGDPNFRPFVTGQSPIETPEDIPVELLITDVIVVDEDNVFPDDFTLKVFDGENYTHVGNEVTPTLNFNGELSVAITVDDGVTLNALKLASAVYSLFVTVTPVNDDPTDIILNGTVIPGGGAVGEIVGVFSTVDPDEGDEHTWSLVAAKGALDNSFFTIVGNELRTAEVFDAAVQDTFSILVETEDLEGATTQKQFALTVTPSEPEGGCGAGPGVGGFTLGDLGRSRGDILLGMMVAILLLARSKPVRRN